MIPRGWQNARRIFRIAMNFRLILTLATLGCATLVSCYPYNEHDRRRDPRRTPQKTVSSQDQQKIEAQREKMKQKQAQDQVAKDTETKEKQDDTAGTGTKPPPDRESSKPPVEEKKEYVFAQKVPGKEGFVFSPYNNQVVDVRDIPSGTLVRDPTYSGTGKGYFRVP